MTEFDPQHLLEVLIDEEVDFVLIGGYAAVLHGASRPTEDVDVTPAADTDNLTRLIKALERLDAKIRTDAVHRGLPFSTSAEAMRGLLMLNLTTESGDLDISFHPSGTEGYSDLIRGAEERSLGKDHDPGRGARRHRPIQGSGRPGQRHPRPHGAPRTAPPRGGVARPKRSIRTRRTGATAHPHLRHYVARGEGARRIPRRDQAQGDEIERERRPMGPA